MDVLAEYFKSIRPEPFPDLLSAIQYIHQNVIDPVPLLEQLNLDDFLDFFDEFIILDQVFFQLEMLQVLTSHFKRSQLEFEQQVETDPKLSNQTAKRDFLAPDYSAIYTSLATAAASKFLIDGAADFLADNFIMISSYQDFALSFYCSFAYPGADQQPVHQNPNFLLKFAPFGRSFERSAEGDRRDFDEIARLAALSSSCSFDANPHQVPALPGPLFARNSWPEEEHLDGAGTLHQRARN